MQLVDRRIPFLEVQVVTIRDARIVTHPLADFCQALSSDREKGTERMTHDMRRDPGKVLLKLVPHEFKIEMERADEIGNGSDSSRVGFPVRRTTFRPLDAFRETR